MRLHSAATVLFKLYVIGGLPLETLGVQCSLDGDRLQLGLWPEAAHCCLRVLVCGLHDIASRLFSQDYWHARRPIQSLFFLHL